MFEVDAETLMEQLARIEEKLDWLLATIPAPPQRPAKNQWSLDAVGTTGGKATTETAQPPAIEGEL